VAQPRVERHGKTRAQRTRRRRPEGVGASVLAGVPSGLTRSGIQA
jgi:hypothetical protein